MQFTLFVQNLQEGWFSGSEHVTIGGNTEDWLQIKFHPPTSAVKNRYPVDLLFAYSPDREPNSRVSFPGPLAITLSVGAEADSSVAQPAPEPASVRPDGSVYSTTHAVSDSPADRDSLGFDEVADAFAALVESASTEPPTTIGIEGTWGTGKSTLMRMIAFDRVAFDRVHYPNIIAIREGINIRFDVWENSDAPKIWAGLLRKILRELESRVTVRQRLSFFWERRWSNRYGRLGYWGPRFGGLVGGLLTIILALVYAEGDVLALSELFGALATVASGVSFSGAARNMVSSPATTQLRSFLSEVEPSAATDHMEQLSRDIEFLGIKIAEGTKIVIFVDNLDRVKSEKVVEVLEAVNLDSLVKTRFEGSTQRFSTCVALPYVGVGRWNFLKRVIYEGIKIAEGYQDSFS